MINKIGFDSEKYLKLQSEKIKERIAKFGGKLYMEFGGKLFDDFHASRVLPGYNPNNKIKLLESLKDDAEIIFCISASDIEKNKIRADFGITYDMEVLRLIDSLRKIGLKINSVVITLFTGQPAAIKFKNKLERHNEKVYLHLPTKGYPTDVETIVSDEGYGKNPYIETTRPLIVVAAPGPGSGKLGTCLSQLYHEFKRGNKVGYAKFETFPVWNLPLKHPVNIAYEAATSDLKDVNMLDSYHLEAHGEVTVNYNRDLDVFPVLKEILKKITGEYIYLSPTDMGVNMIGYCITDDDVCKEASKQEIIRRFFRQRADYKRGRSSQDSVERIQLLMNELNISPSDRACVQPAIDKEKATHCPSVSIELKDGRMIVGRNTEILTASASALLNAIKVLANIDDKLKIISPTILLPILEMKEKLMDREKGNLTLKDVLIALAISAKDNDIIKNAYEKISLLKGCEAHSTHLLHQSNEETFRQLKINITCEDKFLSENLYDA